MPLPPPSLLRLGAGTRCPAEPPGGWNVLCWREFTCRAGHRSAFWRPGVSWAAESRCWSLPPHDSPDPHPQALPPRCLPRAVLPGAREQGKFNYRYLFFQPSPQPVFGRLEQGNFGALPAALGNNTVFKLCLGLWTPRLQQGEPLGSRWGQGIRAAG